MSRNVQTGFARAGDGVGLHWRHYSVDRPRSRVILIHALAMDGSTWAEVIDALPEDVSAIAADCRGHGISDTGMNDFTLKQFADDIAAVLDAAGWDRAVIAGCSMGGCVAQAVAVHHPERTAGLVLIDTTASYGPNACASWAARADKAGASGLQSVRPFQRKRWFSDAFQTARPDRVAETEAVFLRTDPSAYARSCAMLGSADLRGALVGLCRVGRRCWSGRTIMPRLPTWPAILSPRSPAPHCRSWRARGISRRSNARPPSPKPSRELWTGARRSAHDRPC